jgi:hypothetical protein
LYVLLKEPLADQVWWFTPAIPALRRWREEDWEFETNVG